MRRILIDRARDRNRLKRGGGARKMPIELEDVLDDEVAADDLIAMDEALERLAEQDPVAAELARLRLFAGLTHGGRREGPRPGPPDGRSDLGLRPGLALRRPQPARAR